MAQKQGSAGVTIKEIDISGPITQQPTGIPAGIVGTALKGPAFVPITVGNMSDWYSKFGKTDGKKFGPLAVSEWLGNGAGSATYLRVLGVGDGRKRSVTTGKVTSAGFVVGEKLPNSNGAIVDNTEAVLSGELGRLYFLGCLMSESAGSTIFSDAGLQGIGSVTPVASASLPVIRGVLMAPSGVVLRLSSSVPGVDSSAPSTSVAGSNANAKGSALGSVVLSSGGTPKQDFTLLLNGHKGTNVITASFDPTSNSHFSLTFNTDPYKIKEKGHFLYANWDIHPTLAVVTGTGIVLQASGASANTPPVTGQEPCAFLLTSSLDRNTGDSTVPNYESFEDRFSHAVSPWVISQKFGGFAQNLFRLHSLDDGANVSNLFKISIENIGPSSDPMYKYGSFDVILRSWSDRDTEVVRLPNEVFRGLSLDPTSERYIAKVIGDVHAYFDFDREESEQKLVVEGNYENRSNYVRVEVHPDVENGFVDPTAIPMGFRGIEHLVTSGSAPMQGLSVSENSSLEVSNFVKRAVTPPLPMRKKVTVGKEWTAVEVAENSLYWGTQFEHPLNLSQKNESVTFNKSLNSFVKYFPNFALSSANFATGSNTGAPDTAALGIIDADRFCKNLFTLENIQVVTGSNGLVNTKKWNKAVYCRNGAVGSTNITELGSGADEDGTKVRGFTTSDLAPARSFAKFTFVMQGGNNGVNIFDEDEVEINNNAVTADMDIANARAAKPEEGPNVRTYLKALDLMKNTVNMDIQVLAIPGIREPAVTDAAVLAVEERFDAMYLMDIEQIDENGEDVKLSTQIPSVTNTVTSFTDRSVDSSFAAAYFPDLLYKDPTGVNMFVPPSVVTLGVLSLTDRNGFPWFAPAGETRGVTSTSVLEPRVQLYQSEMDTLYNNSINPIVQFASSVKNNLNPKGNVVVWGQKTLQVAASALDRINVRRLLIEIRRQVRDIARTVLFEPNREATLASFSAAVTPRLQFIQSNGGLERFRVAIDASTTTQDDILNNTIRGKIFVQPTKTAEFISLDFVVANNLQQQG